MKENEMNSNQLTKLQEIIALIIVSDVTWFIQYYFTWLSSFVSWPTADSTCIQGCQSREFRWSRESSVYSSCKLVRV